MIVVAWTRTRPTVAASGVRVVHHLEDAQAFAQDRVGPLPVVDEKEDIARATDGDTVVTVKVSGIDDNGREVGIRDVFPKEGL